MHTMPCKILLPHPLMFADKDQKQKKINVSKWNVYHIIPHVLTKKMSTHNYSLMTLYSSRDMGIFMLIHVGLANGTKSAGFEFEKIIITRYILSSTNI